MLKRFLTLCMFITLSACSLKQRENNELVLKGNQMLENGYYESAIGYYKEVLENHPDSVEEVFTFNMLFECYEKLERYNDGIELAGVMIEKYPHLSDGYKALGQSFQGLGNYDLALENFWIASQLDTNSLTTFTAAILAENCNKPEDAIKFYKECINKDPNFYNAYYNLSVILIKLGRYEEARNYSAILLAQNINDKRANELYIEVLNHIKINDNFNRVH